MSTTLTAPVPFAGVANPPEQIPPRWDKDFIDRCLWDLITHAGQWRRLGLLYAEHSLSGDRCCEVREAVDRGRRIGLLIEGDRGCGYRLVGIRHPERIYLSKPGDYERGKGHDDEAPGQLTLSEVGGVG